MCKRKKLNPDEKPIERIYISLNSPEADSINLLTIARKLSKQLELNWNPIYEEMTSTGDYDTLVEVFDKHFREFVILY